MAYEKNQYSYFQNINLDSDGALIVNTNGGSRTTMSNPIVLSAITITGISSWEPYNLDIDGTNGNTFTLNFTLEYNPNPDPFEIPSIAIEITSLSNFNNGDILYFISNFNNADLETRQLNYGFTNIGRFDWTVNVNGNTNPKCIIFTGQVWDNQLIIPYYISSGSVN